MFVMKIEDRRVRTIVIEVKDGPVLSNEWATWRRKARPFKLSRVEVEIHGEDLSSVEIAGPLVLKGERLSDVSGDRHRFYASALKRMPDWLVTLVADATGGITSATYPDPAGGTSASDPIGVGE